VNDRAGSLERAREEGLSGLLRAFVVSPLNPETWRAVAAILLGLVVAIVSIGILSTFFSTGGTLLIWLVGIPIIGLGIEFSRLVAREERWRMTWIDRRPLVAHAYRSFAWPPRAPYGTWVREWAEAEFLDANRWRDVVYVLLLVPLAVLEFVVAFGLWAAAIAFVATPAFVAGLSSIDPGPPLDDPSWAPLLVVPVLVGLVLVPVAASVSRGLMILHRAVVEGLLCVSPTEALRQDVERLRGSRSAALELEASELRRIERDLHDGAQQRLVALAIDLGLAEERIDTDPAAARALVASARDQARQALAELRDIVRGVAPGILTDRGLEAAVGTVAGGCLIPTIVDSALAPGERMPPAVERAAYFIVGESLANVAKHSGATRCAVHLAREEDRLTVRIEDDGVGGATVVPGGGLAGLRDRAEALDGSLEVTSPRGGPTVVSVVLPIRDA
jgi:signal transduction histidine kinase